MPVLELFVQNQKLVSNLDIGVDLFQKPPSGGFFMPIDVTK